MNRRTVDRLTSAALHDLDAAGPGHELSEDERARADAAFLRIVAAPDEPSLLAVNEARRRAPVRRRLLAGAGLVGAAAAGSSALLLGGTAYGSWTPTPERLDAAAATRAADSCRTALEVPDRGEEVVLAEERGDWTYVLLADSRTQAACLLPNALVGRDDPADYEGETFGEYDPDNPAAPHVPRDGIDETMYMSGRTDEGLFNWSEGYVGRDVVGLTVHTPTGLRVQASVARGRFAAWWPAGEVRGDNPELTEAPTFTVTLADGTTRDTTA